MSNVFTHRFSCLRAAMPRHKPLMLKYMPWHATSRKCLDRSLLAKRCLSLQTPSW